MSSTFKKRSRPRLALRLALGLALPLLATQAHAEEPGRYSALDTLRRAQVGTFSPRLAPPVRVQETPRGGARQFERMECRHDPSRPLERAIICTPEGTLLFPVSR